jgi:uridine monophosphate synthetase
MSPWHTTDNENVFRRSAVGGRIYEGETTLPKPANISFIEKLTHAIDRNDSLLCLGLDPDPRKFPDHFPRVIDTAALLNWGKTLIEQTTDLVCCYKPNFAFYEQYGPAGLEALRQTIAAVPDDIPVLLDAKRGDIDSTAAAYAWAAFEVWGADAITISPYLGQDSVAPFLAYPGKMVFILGYTSNPSAKEVQEFGNGNGRLFEHIARQGQMWGSPVQVGFVVGATQLEALAHFRDLAPDHWLLAPGVGAQGGDLTAALQAGLDSQGSGLIVPVSRGIIYAADPGEAARALRDEINQARRPSGAIHFKPFDSAQDKSASHLETSPTTTLPYAELILQLHEVGCVQFGQFTLASGLPSPIYIDLRRITASPTLLRRAAQAYADLLQPLTFDHLAAVPYAALTIGTAVALTTHSSLIYPRKEVKVYGTSKTIEGVFSAGDRAVVIEDLITSGGSILKAIETLTTAGLVVSDVVVLIDREQAGAKALAKAGYRLHAVLRLSEILKTLAEAGRISAEQVAVVERYLREVAS